MGSTTEMHAPHDPHRVLHTTAGDFPLLEYRLHAAGHAWSILHTGAVLTPADEAHFFRELMPRLPYGVALWPAAIALAHDIASRADAFRGRRVLELGAGTGLPGIVAASLGAHVVQTDRHELALALCQRNAAWNGVQTIEHRLADWTSWTDAGRYDWILGADILYGEVLHPHLHRIFASNLAPGGRILLADPFRAVSFRLLEALEADSWTIAVSKWSIGEDAAPRAIGLFDLTPPRYRAGARRGTRPARSAPTGAPAEEQSGHTAPSRCRAASRSSPISRRCPTR
jgi:predicted nicotinamide N-methyase